PIRGTIEFVPGEHLSYMLLPRTAQKLRTNGTGPLTTGFVRLTPAAGSSSPVSTSVFSYRQNGITVTEASVQGATAMPIQRITVSASGGGRGKDPHTPHSS